MKKLYPAVKSGRAWNGAHRDAGKVVHLLEKDDYPSWDNALCGATLGSRGNGWHFEDNESISATCKKCIEKSVKITQNNERLMEEIMVYQLEIKGQPTIVFKTLSDLMLNLESFTEDELTDTTGDIDVKISSKQMTEEEYEGLLEFQGY